MVLGMLSSANRAFVYLLLWGVCSSLAHGFIGSFVFVAFTCWTVLLIFQFESFSFWSLPFHPTTTVLVQALPMSQLKDYRRILTSVFSTSSAPLYVISLMKTEKISVNQPMSLLCSLQLTGKHQASWNDNQALNMCPDWPLWLISFHSPSPSLQTSSANHL